MTSQTSTTSGLAQLSLSSETGGRVNSLSFFLLSLVTALLGLVLVTSPSRRARRLACSSSSPSIGSSSMLSVAPSSAPLSLTVRRTARSSSAACLLKTSANSPKLEASGKSPPSGAWSGSEPDSLSLSVALTATASLDCDTEYGEEGCCAPLTRSSSAVPRAALRVSCKVFSRWSRAAVVRDG